MSSVVVNLRIPAAESASLDRQLEAGRLQNGVQRREARIPARGQGAIQALAWHSGGLGDLGHAFCLGNRPEGRKIDTRVSILRGCVQILRGKPRVGSQLSDETLAV
jgi:hypothetical protein